MKLKKLIDDGAANILAFLLVRAAAWWSERFMDQWESWCFDTKYGRCYLNITRSTKYPDSFELVSRNGRHIGSRRWPTQ